MPVVSVYEALRALTIQGKIDATDSVNNPVGVEVADHDVLRIDDNLKRENKARMKLQRE